VEAARIVILGSNGLKKLGLVSTFRKSQLATLATWSNFGGSAKMSISLRLWWTRGDSNPRPPRCERGHKSKKARRCNHLAFLDAL